MKFNLAIVTILLNLTYIGQALAANHPPVVVALAKQAGISEDEARVRFDQSIAAITGELSSGRDVTITNFGKFYLSEREARTARNPRTGAPIAVAAKRYPKFTSADRLKEIVNPAVTVDSLASISVASEIASIAAPGNLTEIAAVTTK